jgi:penicillin amidase
VFLLIVLALGGSAGYLYYRGRASLPQIDGSFRLTGLSATVEVLRDPFGIPHLFGSTLEDLARAAGFVHAQDRFFQMEMSRRIGSGTLAEILGESALPLDRRVRLHGLGLAARTELDRTDPEARRMLDAYADGVNAYLEAHRDKLPPELQILGLKPSPWEAADSLAIVKWMSYLLSENGSVELLRARLADTVGIESAYLLTGLSPPVEERVGLLGAPGPLVRGSLQSHLPLAMPSVWYEIHLSGGGLDVAGASLPGIPFVIIGHNDRIAWGATALYADVQDHYLETLDPADNGQYAALGVWESFEVFSETIRVAGASPVTMQIQRSRHGVVISEQPRDGQVLALRWDGPWNGDSALALLRLNQAAGWIDFTEALRTLTSPALAFVYADVEGNIGFFPAGEIPVRVGFDGSLPVDGASGEFEWQGYIPHEMKPVVLNPEEGFIVSANQKMVPDDSDYPLGRDQLAPFRANRILALVGSRAQLGVADFQAIQADRYDISTESLLRYLVALDVEPGEASAAQRLLRAWDGKMGRGSAPALYQAFYLRLLENTFQDDVGEALYPDLLDFIEIGFPGGIYSIVEDPNSVWWDHRATAAVEDRTAIFKQSFEEATALLSTRQGRDPSDWDWATLHGVLFEHPLGRERALGWIFNRGPAPFGGSTFTIANAMVSLTEPFRAPAGTSLRLVIDVGNWNAMSSVISTGASGHPLSPHYFDQNRDWQTGRNHPLLFERAQIEGALEGRLVLNP